MSTFSLTDFTATAGTAITAFTAVDGTTFSKHFASGDTLPPVINPSGFLVGQESGTNSVWISNKVLPVADYQHTVRVQYGGAAFDLTGAHFRMQAGANTMYAATLGSGVNSSAGVFDLYKVVAGTVTELANASPPGGMVLNEQYDITGGATGTRIWMRVQRFSDKLWLNAVGPVWQSAAVDMASVTDTAISAAGSVGFRLANIGASASKIRRFAAVDGFKTATGMLSLSAKSNPANITAPNKVLPGMNFGIAENYTDKTQFLNLMRSADNNLGNGAWQGTGAAYVDSNGWPTAVPVGLAVDKIVKYFTGGTPQPNWRLGRYVLTWAGNFSASVTGLGVSNTAATANRIEFDSPTADNVGGTFIQVALTSLANGATLTDVKVFDKSKEALVNAGELFDPDFLLSISNAKILRFMEWDHTNSFANTVGVKASARRVSDIPTEATCSWRYSVPPSVWAKLCAKAGTDMWANVPHGGESLTYTANNATGVITTDVANIYTEAAPIVFYAQLPPAPLSPNVIYYARNIAGNGFQVYTVAAGGTPITLTGATVGGAYVTGVYNRNAIYQTIANQVASVTAFIGKAYVEYSNEWWNTGFAQTIWMNGPSSIGLSGVDINGTASTNQYDLVACGAAYESVRAWSAFETAIGRSRVVRTLAGQSGAFNTRIGVCLEYTDPIAGTKLKNLVDLYSPTCYFYQAANNGYTAAQVSEKLQAEREDYLQPDAWWLTYMNASVDAALTTHRADLINARVKVPNILIAPYESNHHFTLLLGQPTVTSTYLFTLNADPTILDSAGAVDISAGFRTGEEISISDSSPSFTSPTGSVSFTVPYYVRVLNTTQIRAYRTLADYTADLPATRIVFGAGTTYIDNWTRKNLLYQRWLNWLTGTNGPATMQRLYDGLKQSGTNGWVFFAAGNAPASLSRTGNKYGFFWSLDGVKTTADTVNPLAAWYRALVP